MPPADEQEIISGKDKNINKFVVKECLEKIGFGLGSSQFINILFMQTGASYFLLGLINGLRVVFGNLTYYLIEKYKHRHINKLSVSISGIVFGFSFLLIGISIFVKSVILFSIAIIIGSIFIVIYGESINLILMRKNIVEKVARYGLIITTISLFFAAFMMDMFSIEGKYVVIDILGKGYSFEIYGYLLVFEVAAIVFIVAGYILSKLKLKEIETSNVNNADFGYFFKNKFLLTLIITNIVTAIVQTVGYTYYGVFIYHNFMNSYFHGFMNVAVVFLISVFTSLIGYVITKLNTKVYKKMSMLIFGLMMVLVMPICYFLFGNDLSILTMATIVGVIGSSAVGVTNSMLAIELINHELRQAYFSFINMVTIPVFLVVIPIFSAISQFFGLNVLFLSLSIMMAVLIVSLSVFSIVFKKEIV